MNIYLDNAATTKPCNEAISAAMLCMSEDYGNPSSLHMMGVNAEERMKTARRQLASALFCEEENILFTSGATESNNLAIKGAAATYGRRRKRIVTTSVEHPSVKDTVKSMESAGFDLVFVSPDSSGTIRAEDILAAVDDNTCLVSCMLVNNEIGAVLPVKEAFTQIKRRFPEVITHCDAVQGFLKLPFKAAGLSADLISLSAHKVHGVKGVGALYIKKGVRLLPIIHGGGQERGLRSGTESVPLIAAFGAAVELGGQSISERLANADKLRGYLLERIAAMPDISVNSPSNGSPYITNISVRGIRSEIMLHFLESRGIYVSSGSACSKGKKSAVLGEFGISDKDADSALRISISSDTTQGDIDSLIAALSDGADRLMKSK